MKILFLDIETSPNLGYVWGLWQQNIALNQIKDSGEVICYAAKWLGNDEIFFRSIYSHSKKSMLKSVHKLLDEADAVVHYNGKRFDIPYLNAEFVKYGLTPPSPYKEIDLLETAKNRFKLPSNKLEYVVDYFGVGKKVKTTGFELWRGCMAGDPESWYWMEQYNINDILILEGLYNKVLPWIKNHTNYSLFSDDALVCPNCGSSHLNKRGFHYTIHSKFQRYKCMDCGHWLKDNKILNRNQYKTSSI